MTDLDLDSKSDLITSLVIGLHRGGCDIWILDIGGKHLDGWTWKLNVDAIGWWQSMGHIDNTERPQTLISQHKIGIQEVPLIQSRYNFQKVESMMTRKESMECSKLPGWIWSSRYECQRKNMLVMIQEPAQANDRCNQVNVVSKWDTIPRIRKKRY